MAAAAPDRAAALSDAAVAALAASLGRAPRGVRAAAALLADGATVPFVARYRAGLTDGHATPSTPLSPRPSDCYYYY